MKYWLFRGNGFVGRYLANTLLDSKQNVMGHTDRARKNVRKFALSTVPKG